MWEVPIPNADLTAWDYINAKTAILLGFKDLFITKNIYTTLKNKRALQTRLKNKEINL